MAQVPEATAVDQLLEGALLPAGGGEELIAEVEHGDELAAVVPAPHTQHVRAASVEGPHVGPGVEGRLGAPQLLQPAQAHELLALAGVRVAAHGGQIPLEGAPVEVAAVLPLLVVQVVGVVVELPHLVAAVEDRDATLGEHPGVEHQVAGDGALQLEGVPLIVGGLHAAQGGGGAAQPGIAQRGASL